MREAESGRGMMDHAEHDMMEKPKSKPWLGYYDFLITEGSYKFWVVFEVSFQLKIAYFIANTFSRLNFYVLSILVVYDCDFGIFSIRSSVLCEIYDK